MIPDIEELLKTYADWIAWLRAKRAELETQRAKLKTASDGETVVTAPGSPVEAQPAPHDAPVPVASQEEDIPDWL